MNYSGEKKKQARQFLDLSAIKHDEQSSSLFDLDNSNEHSASPFPQAEEDHLIFEDTLPGGKQSKEDDTPDILQAFETNGFN